MFEALLQNIFYRFGTSILKFNSVLGFGFLFLAFGFLSYSLVYHKEKKKKNLGRNGFTLFLINGVFCFLYPSYLVFGQIFMKYFGK